MQGPALVSGVGVNASGPTRSESEGEILQTKTEGHHCKWGKWMLSCQHKEIYSKISPK